MSTADLFTIYNLGVMPFWALLVLAPRWKVTDVLVHSGLVPVVLGVSYIGFLGTAMAGSEEGIDFLSLEGVMAGFTDEVAVLGAWIHYLVFDLFVGAWEARDAQRRGISHVVVIPCLILTLMFGPVGLLLYLVIRGVTKGTWKLAEA